MEENKKASDMNLREYYLGIAMEIYGKPEIKFGKTGKAGIDYSEYVKKCNELVDNMIKLSK